MAGYRKKECRGAVAAYSSCHREDGWYQHPPIRRQYMIMLRAGEHISPTGKGFTDAEPEKRKRHLGQYELRHEQGGLCEYDSENLWQYVAPQQIYSRRSEAAR